MAAAFAKAPGRLYVIANVPAVVDAVGLRSMWRWVASVEPVPRANDANVPVPDTGQLQADAVNPDGDAVGVYVAIGVGVALTRTCPVAIRANVYAAPAENVIG